MNYVVIPAYKPDKRLLKLIVALNKKLAYKIIVINDGSGKEYNKLFEQVGLYATVITHKENLGKGTALKSAFDYIRKINKSGIVITADSDGQHTPKDIMKIANECADKKNTIITGVRCFKGKVPIKSKIGNNITKYVFFLSTGFYLKDTQCGLRAFHTLLIPFMLETEGDRYEYEMNVLLRATKQVKIEAVPIETIYINNNSNTHFRPVKDAFMIYKNILKFSISSIISFIIDYILYTILVTLFIFLGNTTKLILANVIARIVSAIVNYIINKKYVFNNYNNHKKTVWKYILLAMFILLLNTVIMILLKNIGLENLYLLKLLTEVILFSLSFIMQKLIILKKFKLKS